MTAYTELAIEVLKDKGFRITKPRRLVLELLDGTNAALSAYEIKDKLDKLGEKVDTVSVYRILETLEETHLIHRVLTTGKVRKCQLEREETCHLHQEEHCHHLLICEGCEAVEEVHCPGVEALVKGLEKRTQFKIHSHNMEFRGLCARCG